MRRSELKRKTRLSADPEVTRAFVERAREAGLSTDPIKLAEFVRRGRSHSARATKRVNAAALKRKEGPLSPEEWRHAVAQNAGLRCTVTGARARDADDPMFDAHHALPKRELRARGLHAYVYDARNGVFLASGVHYSHEFGAGNDDRVPRGCLPAAVWSFCRDMDRLGEGEWATAMVERAHPIGGRGQQRHSREGA